MKSKRTLLKECLIDADRRFNIAISRMSEITNRVHELEVLRNLFLRTNFILDELDKTDNPILIKELTNELKSINSNESNDMVYCEIVQGYRSMSRRKNELEEERNYYVKELENLK